ncbi:hypothetical protein EJ04DRAFT_132568 [Polyplosphaeria fusca]|uniref:Haloacid dehalogenase n=1 Tax=Polyplosphaeria fusca TaxID=682080 RepID=A0A9P4UTC8_9PLEO|nr:hypothetical protein EJ04DRAFT_132568 [Polyplosphaeria fusca]
MARKKNLLLALDAFGTIFTPKNTVFAQYAEVARSHRVSCPSDSELQKSFKVAFKDESKQHPNYGKAVGMGAATWWANVITKTFQPHLKQEEQIPRGMISDLLTRFSTKDGYAIYPDVLPFFEMLCRKKAQPSLQTPWTWDTTVVGVITNSDDRVPGVLESLGLTVGPRRVGTPSQRSKETGVDRDISFVVLSYDVGYEKPHQKIFDAAKQMLQETLIGEKPEDQRRGVDDFELLYVGDEIQKDYMGAQNAGWHAVLVERDSDEALPSPEDLHIVKRDVDTTDESCSTTREQVSVINDLRALCSWSPGT